MRARKSGKGAGHIIWLAEKPYPVQKRDKRNVQLTDGTKRADIAAGLNVSIVLKQDQRTGKLTHGVVRNILTKSATHPHGIKVRLENGLVGRVKSINR